MFVSNTPLFDAAQSKVRENRANFHTPGHKGRVDGKMSFSNLISRYDLTEIQGLDSLYAPTGAIKKLEDNLSKIYRTKRSIISCGGATLGVQTMIALCVKPKEKILLGRDIHVSAINALTFLDIDPVWIIPKKDAGEFLPGRITKEQIEAHLEADGNIKAVYITSPDYFGIVADVKGISKICQKHGIPLLVDNAHGAHLAFISDNLHPIHQGADICVDSAHKTLPVLTGSAFLHISNEKYIDKAKDTMALFGSTSPSYLMMITIDNFVGEVLDGGSINFIRYTQEMLMYQDKIKKLGYRVPKGDFDITRFVISADVFGYTGEEFYWWLRSANIEPETYFSRFVVLIASIRNQKEDYDVLMNALIDLPKMKPLDLKEEYNFRLPKKVMSARDAFFSKTETIDVNDAIGKVSAKSKSVCPPGIPIVMAGEEIDENVIEALKIGGVFSIKVVI